MSNDCSHHHQAPVFLPPGSTYILQACFKIATKVFMFNCKGRKMYFFLLFLKVFKTTAPSEILICNA